MGQFRMVNIIITAMNSLLEWINHQLAVLSPLSFAQLQNSEHLGIILLRVDPHYFLPLQGTPLNIPTYLALMDKYLAEVIGKRIKRMLRGILCNQITQFSKYVLYLAVQSGSRGGFVTTIMELDDYSQNNLMQLLKGFEGHLEKIMEVNDIIDKVDELEEENRSLLQQIQQIEMKNAHLYKHIEQTKAEQDCLGRQTKMNRLERANAMETLGLNGDADYLSIYANLKQETGLLYRTYEKEERRNGELLKTKQEMMDKAEEDELVIAHLEAEIERYRQLQTDLKEQISVCEVSNKENTKTPTSRLTFETTKLCHTLLEDDEDEDLFALETRVAALRAEANVLLKGNALMERQNRKKESQVKAARRSMQILSHEYDKTVVRF